ncbi:MAG: Methyltransferase-like protein 16 [Candelina submexicana]|nr:MAG: Methyltransferase-like protein 16 [Candelina submexicana]
MDVARNIPSLPRNLLPFPSTYIFSIPATSPSTTASRLNTLLSSLDLQWQYRASISTGVGFAARNVWSRASRRERQQQQQSINESEERDGRVEGGDEDEDMSDEEEDEEEVALGFKIEVGGMKKDGKEEAEGEEQGTEVRIRWLRGKESVLFESFCGMVRRKLTGGFTGGC